MTGKYINATWQERHSEEDKFLDAVNVELYKARKKFPSSVLSVAALMEEVGELAQAMLKVHSGKWSKERIREEAIQVAAMAMRVALEGDASFNCGYSEPGEHQCVLDALSEC